MKERYKIWTAEEIASIIKNQRINEHKLWKVLLKKAGLKLSKLKIISIEQAREQLDTYTKSILTNKEKMHELVQDMNSKMLIRAITNYHNLATTDVDTKVFIDYLLELVNPRDRSILFKYYEEDWSYAEISADLVRNGHKINILTVSKILTESINKMVVCLDYEYKPELNNEQNKKKPLLQEIPARSG